MATFLHTKIMCNINLKSTFKKYYFTIHSNLCNVKRPHKMLSFSDAVFCSWFRGSLCSKHVRWASKWGLCRQRVVRSDLTFSNIFYILELFNFYKLKLMNNYFIYYRKKNVLLIVNLI
jgi:hypothetical protein